MNQSIEANQSINPKRKRGEESKAILEYVPSPDAEERLLQAYEMIFKDIPSGEVIGPSEDPKPGEQQRLF